MWKIGPETKWKEAKKRTCSQWDLNLGREGQFKWRSTTTLQLASCSWGGSKSIYLHKYWKFTLYKRCNFLLRGFGWTLGTHVGPPLVIRNCKLSRFSLKCPEFVIYTLVCGLYFCKLSIRCCEGIICSCVSQAMSVLS